MKKLLMVLACLIAVNGLKADSVDWTILTGNAEYGMRAFFSGVTKNASLYVVAGQNNISEYYNDVWYSNNGVEWNALTKNAEFEKRTNNRTVVYENIIYLISGNNGSTFYNDIWISSDGIEWTALTRNAEFGNDTFVSGAVVFNGKIFVTKNKEVYSSINKIEWTTLTKNAEFDDANNHNIIVYNNKIFMIGGYSYGDTWSSEDGIDWTLLTKNAGFGTSPILSSIVYNNKIYTYNFADKKLYVTTDGVEFTEVTSEGMHNLYSPNGFFTTINNSIVLCDSYYSGIDNKYVWMGTIIEETATITPSFTALSTIETPTTTITPTNTATTTKTVTKTITATHSITDTRTPTLTVTQSWTASNTNTPTITATPTRTNTPLTTPTVTVTVTPILTLEPILRYVSTDYDNHKTTLRLEWTKYDDNALQYYLTVYDRTYQHESTTVLNNSADISPDLEWLTHDLIGLRYDYCYNIGLTITSSNWSEPVYADTIVICPYESPTPFAGTPTASNTPDCTLPTDTPSPAITVNVTVGYVLYETNEDKTPTAFYSGALSTPIAGTTVTYQTLTRGGSATNIAVQFNDAVTANFLTYPSFVTSTSLVMTGWIYKNSATNDQRNISFIGTYGNSDATAYIEGYRGDSEHMHYALGTGYTGAIFDFQNMRQKWYYQKTLLYNVTKHQAHIVYWEGNTNTAYYWADIGMRGANMNPGTYGAVRSGISNGVMFFDDFCIQKGTTVTVKNLPIDSTLIVYDAYNNTKVSFCTGTGEIQWDTTWEYIPITCKFAIIKNGNLLYADTATREVFGGDVYPLTTPTP